MKKIISVILVIVLLLSLSACGGTAESSSEIAGDPSSSAPTQSGDEPASTSTSYNEYPSLAQTLDYFTETGLYWRFELPDMKYGREHIAVTKELQSEINRILTEYEPQFRPELEANEDRDCDWDYGPIFIGIDGSDDGFYTNGNQLVFAHFVQLGPNDPLAPNTTLLSLHNQETYESESYIYPANMYGDLLSLFSANIVETHADFEGDYTRMALSRTDIYPVWGETLECGNTLLHSSYAYSADDTPPNTKWQLEALDLHTGKSLYYIDSSSFGDRGAMMRVSALSDITDYDYVMFFENGYAYRNSNDSSKEIYYALPQEVKPVQDASRSTTFYDEHDDYIAWADIDGIHLRTAKQDGVAQKLILPNVELPAMFPRPDYPDGLIYAEPRFICNGTKVAAMVYSELTFDSFAVVVFDTASGKISSQLAYTPSATALYPIIDRYVATRGFISNTKLLDAETGETADLNLAWVGRSYDYKTFIVLDYTSLDANSAPAYICNINNIKDRSKPLLRPGNPYVSVNLPDVTEHYAIFNVGDFDGNWLAVAKYR